MDIIDRKAIKLRVLSFRSGELDVTAKKLFHLEKLFDYKLRGKISASLENFFEEIVRGIMLT